MGLLKKLCLPNATLFFLSQVTLMMKYYAGHAGEESSLGGQILVYDF